MYTQSKAEADMKSVCFICGNTNYEFERRAKVATCTLVFTCVVHNATGI